MRDYHFGNFVFLLRENKGMTQQDLADMLGVTPAAVSKWENGSSKPRVETLFQLAEIFDVRPEELIAGQFIVKETISPEAMDQIRVRYEYLSKIESYGSTRAKLKRLLSSLIDFSMAMVLTWIVVLLIYELVTAIGVDSGTESIACILSLAISFALFFGLRDFLCFGKSVGKRIMRLMVLDKPTGKEASRTQKLFQNSFPVILIFITTPLLLLDVIIMLIRGQSIGDSVANVVVVEKAPQETQIISEQPTDAEIQKLNAYMPSSGPSIKFIVGLVCVIAAIIVIAIGLIVLYFAKYDSVEIVNTDITQYEEDCRTYCNASAFMPELESLTDFVDLTYSHKTSYSRFFGFAGEGLALFVQYDPLVYEAKTKEIMTSTTFLNAPVFKSGYTLPVTEFLYKNYYMKVIPDEQYIDYCACKSFALIGFDDDNKCIVYCYHYNIDLDYIAEKGEDLEAEMRTFMDGVFAWKEEAEIARP